MDSSKICTIIFKYVKKCSMCLHKKREIVDFEDQDHLLNKRSELFLNIGMTTNIYYIITKQTVSLS